MYKLAVRYNICIKGIIKEEDYSVPLPNLWLRNKKVIMLHIFATICCNMLQPGHSYTFSKFNS